MQHETINLELAAVEVIVAVTGVEAAKLYEPNATELVDVIFVVTT